MCEAKKVADSTIPLDNIDVAIVEIKISTIDENTCAEMEMHTLWYIKMIETIR